MPAKLKRCVRKVEARGMPAKSAWPICVKSTGQKPHHKKKKGARRGKSS